MTTRIYVVMHGAERRLIEATSAAQAIRHCVRNKYTAKAATPKEIALLMGQGLTVEKAADDSLIPTGPKGSNEPKLQPLSQP